MIPQLPEYDPGSLVVIVGPRDNYSKRAVSARCRGRGHTDKFDTDENFRRAKFRAEVVSIFDLDDAAHEWLEDQILDKARAADSQTAIDALKPEIVRMVDVLPEQVEWLWPERIAIGKVTLLAGNPGLGKSLATLDMAARVSAGKCWPDNRWEQQVVGGVLLLSAEDDLADTIRPRLDSHGADVSRIVALKSIQGSDAEGDYKRSFDLSRDIEHLRAAIGTVENCRLIVVDPVSAYLGKTDSHKNSDVRNILAPLADFATEMRVAILAVSHLRKGEGAAIYRTMGSMAFIAAARAAWVVTEDQADKRRRLLLPMKNNLGNDGQGLAFRVEPHGLGGSPVVCWESEPVTVSADEAMGSKRGPAPDIRDEAADWLLKQLASGPMPAKETIQAGCDVGFSKRTIHRAFEAIGGESTRSGFPARSTWSLDSRATSCASPARDTLRGTTDDTWHNCENPEEEEEVNKFLSNSSAAVPSSERQAQLDAFEAERLQCNGHDEVPF